MKMRTRCHHSPLCLMPIAALAGAWFTASASAETLYWGGTSSQSWTSSTWSENEAGPFTSPWVSVSEVMFVLPNSLIGGATTQVAGITANESATVTPAGTLGTGGTVAVVTVAAGKTLNFGSQAISAAAGTGWTKEGDGTWILNGSAYSGGFTLQAGSVGIGGANALGAGGALVINGGTLQTSGGNNSRDLSGKFAGGILIGGDFSFAGAGGLQFNDSMTLGAATRTIRNTAAAIISLGGDISGDPGAGLVFDGTGATKISGANSYDGGTSIQSGIVTFSQPAAVPASGLVSVASGATLGIALGGVGAFSESDVTALFNNSFANVDMSAGSRVGIDTTSGDSLLQTSISGSMGLTKLGANKLVISGDFASYDGGTHVPALANTLSSVEVTGNHGSSTGGWNIGYQTAAGSNGSTRVDFTQGSVVEVADGKSIEVGSINLSGGGTHALTSQGSVDNRGSLSIGGQGIVTIENLGVWNQSGDMTMISRAASNSTLQVNASSEFRYTGENLIKMSGASLGSGKSLLNINGGTFETTAGFASDTPNSSGYGRITLSNYGRLRVLADVTNLTSQVQFVLSDGGGVIDTEGDTTLSGITTGLGPNAPATGISGNGDLIKEGSGKLTLTGTNTYSGLTTVAQGALLVNGAITQSWVRVMDEATLGGDGGVIGTGSAHVLIDAGGTLAPGLSTGTLAIDGDVTIAGNYAYEFGGGAGGTQADLLDVSGTVDLSGSSLILSNLGAYQLGDKFTLISYGSLTATFDGYADDSEFSAGGGLWKINYDDASPGQNGGGGNLHVTLTAVPEASCLVLALAGMAAGFRRKRI